MKFALPILGHRARMTLACLTLFGVCHAQTTTVLYRFNSANAFGSGLSAPVLGFDGYMYGVNSAVGANGQGSIFRMSPTGNVETLYSFTSGEANSPKNIMQASDGNFYGIAAFGGTASAGGIFKMTPLGQVTILYELGNQFGTDTGYSASALIEASDGNLYGVIANAGSNFGGIAFRLSLSGNFTIIHSFGDGSVPNEGTYPTAALIQGSDGNLYGTTQLGGANGSGTVFQLTLAGQAQVVYSFGPQFSSSDGTSPEAPLVQGADGCLYGTTDSGGRVGYGTIFKVTLAGAETVLYNFDDNSASYLGYEPGSGLLLAQDGNFYGVTQHSSPLEKPYIFNTVGGQHGTVFQMTPQGKVTFLNDFDSPLSDSDNQLTTGLVPGADGNLYGATQRSIYQVKLGVPGLVSSAAATVSLGVPFTYRTIGSNSPTAFAIAPALPKGLSLDPTTGIITGTLTKAALSTSAYTLSLTNAAGTASIPFSLTIGPNTLPVIDDIPTIFGTVNAPFSYTIPATAGTKILSYATTTLPTGLILNRTTGVISGTPQVSGTFSLTLTASNSAGTTTAPLTLTIFPTTPDFGKEYVVLHRFGNGTSDDEGEQPATPLAQGPNGTFLGVAPLGGVGDPQIVGDDNGTAFLMTTTGSVTRIHAFGKYFGVFDSGKDPRGIILGADGNYYGTTAFGGTTGGGAVFKLTPDGTVSYLHNFGDGSVANDGQEPEAGVIQGSDGNFYGTTRIGGTTGDGTLFRVTPQGVLTILHNFADGTVGGDGIFPESPLTQGTDGLIYGLTTTGGTTGYGVIFKSTTDGAVTILHTFMDGTVPNDGNNLYGGVFQTNGVAGLIQANDGNFYGTTQYGGSTGDGTQYSGSGTVFKMTPGGTITILHSFGDGSVPNDGSHPEAGLIQGLDGNFYGTTYDGGSADLGTVFEITPDGTTETILHHFGDGSVNDDGNLPEGPLIQGPNGDLYGTTAHGGFVDPRGYIGPPGDGVAFVIETNLVPAIPPKIFGATSVKVPRDNPVIYDVQALQLKTGTSGALPGFIKALFFPADQTSNDNYVLAGDQVPILPINLAFDPVTGVISGPLKATPGLYTFSITPQNSFDQGGQRTFTMYVEQAPTIRSSANDGANAGTPYTYQVEVEDYDFPFNYSATGLPDWLTIDTLQGSLTGTPPGPGLFVFSPLATNLQGTTGLQVRLTVASNLPNQPAISSATSASGVVNSLFSYHILAANSPSSYGAANLPPGVHIDAGTGWITGKPTTPGTYIVPITATNPSCTYTSAVVITITATPVPVIVGLPTASAFTNTSFQYQIDAAGAVSTYGVTGLPAGLSFDAMTGVITGIPTAAANSNVTLTATNGSGTGTTTLVLSVTKGNPPTTTTFGSLTATSALLIGSMIPKGLSTTVHFEYGTTTTYGTSTATQDAGNGSVSVPFSLSTGTLTPQTLYHFRAVAVNAQGTSYGADKTFTTLAAPTFAGSFAAPILSAYGAQVGIGINPNGSATTVQFRYSTDPTLATYDLTAPVTVGSGTALVTASGFIGELDANTTYYYQVVTSGAAGPFAGPVGSFTTLPLETGLVAASGTPANGANNAIYGVLGNPIMNESDGVAFAASLVVGTGNPAASSTDNVGIWANQGTGTLQLLAQTGIDLAPDTGGATWKTLSDPVYNDNNAIAFTGTLNLAKGQTGATGFWSTSTGALRLVARLGDHANGGSTFSAFTCVGLSDVGAIVAATIATNSAAGVSSMNNLGIWEGTLESNLAAKVRSGDMVGGKTIATLALTSTQALVGGQTRSFASNTGDLALLATFTDKTTGIVTVTGTTENVVAKAGDPVPGLSGATLASFGSPIINLSDHVAFQATLTLGPGGVTSATNSVILAQDSNGDLQIIAQTGPSQQYATLGDPVYNNNHTVAYTATRKSGKTTLTDLAVQFGGSGQLLAETGGLASGFPTGVTLKSITAIALPDAGSSNNLGGVLFLGTVAGTGITTSNNTAIWMVGNGGSPQLIVRSGDVFNLGTTNAPNYKTVTGLAILHFSAPLSGQTRSFTRSGDLVYLATFGDNSTAIFNVQMP